MNGVRTNKFCWDCEAKTVHVIESFGYVCMDCHQSEEVRL